MAGPKSDRLSAGGAWFVYVVGGFLYFRTICPLLYNHVSPLFPVVAALCYLCTGTLMIICNFSDPGIILRSKDSYLADDGTKDQCGPTGCPPPRKKRSSGKGAAARAEDEADAKPAHNTAIGLHNWREVLQRAKEERRQRKTMARALARFQRQVFRMDHPEARPASSSYVNDELNEKVEIVTSTDSTSTTLESALSSPSADSNSGGAPLGWKFCDTCQIHRPPRSSHCRACDNCIMTLDHHCVWLGTCIGERNYKYFTCLLLCLTFGSWWGLLSCIASTIYVFASAGDITIFTDSHFAMIFGIVAVSWLFKQCCCYVSWSETLAMIDVNGEGLPMSYYLTTPVKVALVLFLSIPFLLSGVFDYTLFDSERNPVAFIALGPFIGFTFAFTSFTFFHLGLVTSGETTKEKLTIQKTAKELERAKHQRRFLRRQQVERKRLKLLVEERRKAMAPIQQSHHQQRNAHTGPGFTSDSLDSIARQVFSTPSITTANSTSVLASAHAEFRDATNSPSSPSSSSSSPSTPSVAAAGGVTPLSVASTLPSGKLDSGSSIRMDVSSLSPSEIEVASQAIRDAVDQRVAAEVANSFNPNDGELISDSTDSSEEDEEDLAGVQLTPYERQAIQEAKRAKRNQFLMDIIQHSTTKLYNLIFAPTLPSQVNTHMRLKELNRL